MPCSASDLTEAQKELLGWSADMAETHTFHVSKSICLLSHYSLGETFERWLTFLQVRNPSKLPVIILSLPLNHHFYYAGTGQ